MMLPLWHDTLRSCPASTRRHGPAGRRRDVIQRPRLARRLGTGDAVVIGLGLDDRGRRLLRLRSGGPGRRAARSWSASRWRPAVAYCNAVASAQLAAQYPTSGGTTSTAASGWGSGGASRAGWGFVVGKTASCAAMALTFASYAATVRMGAPASRARRGGRGDRGRLPRDLADGDARPVLVSRLGRGLLVAVGAIAAHHGEGAGADRLVASATAGSTAYSRRPGCCSSPSPATRASPHWARRCATRGGRFRARSRSRSAITAGCTCWSASRCSSPSGLPRSRAASAPLAAAVDTVGAGWARRSSGSERQSPASARCWP